MIAGVRLQFRNQLGPIGRKRKLGESGISAARSSTRHVDENDWQTALAESARQLGNSANDLTGRMHCRHTDNASLQINHDQGSSGVEFRERHLFSFRLGGGFRRS